MHDVRFHTDVFNGGQKLRVTHYELHYAKYVGRLAALKNCDDEQKFSEGLERTVTDAFIITLAASEALNIDFGQSPRIESKLEKPPAARQKSAAEDLFYELAIYNGGIAKALDSYDHMENFGSGEELRKSVKAIMKILLTTAEQIGLDLEDSTFKRWNEIEACRVL